MPSSSSFCYTTSHIAKPTLFESDNLLFATWVYSYHNTHIISHTSVVGFDMGWSLFYVEEQVCSVSCYIQKTMIFQLYIR